MHNAPVQPKAWIFPNICFFVGYNPACFYEMPLMHLKSIAQSLKEAAGMLHEFCVIILANAEMHFGRQTEHSV